MMRNFFAEFDLLGGLFETIKDVSYTATTGDLPTSIDVDDPDYARQVLEEAGIRVVSVTRGWNSGLVDVPSGQYAAAMRVLFG
jgi:hypothetical protein